MNLIRLKIFFQYLVISIVFIFEARHLLFDLKYLQNTVLDIYDEILPKILIGPDYFSGVSF